MAKTTTELAEWLGKLGLNQYAQAFADNHVDHSVLSDLTENDLQKLGVSLGHRKKLLRAIETLRIESPPSGTKPPISNRDGASQVLEQHREAEFRQITGDVL